ncbi:zinc ribbon domain-containing protein [Massiliimalia massiliensis]|uniref:hypothetical protein n=1 Tax=Massiliimalia massiliensis TaxID=1852384 RepID=UPI00098598D9|nr:hypothetical protein [Massiliimalia massiliensis]
MNWLRNFMVGRYGADQLTLALLIFSFLLSFVLMWVPVPFLSMISYLPLGYGIFRMFSRNILKRGEENARFLAVWSRVAGWFRRTKQHWADRKVYRFTRCPNCRQKIRLPKGRGKLRVTCPKCRRQFEKKT